jgi:hypothetical protein
MAFDPAAYLKSKKGNQKPFDPAAYLSSKGVSVTKSDSPDQEDPTQSKITAAAAGIMNPVGLADEMSAAGSTAMNAISGFSGPLAGGTFQDLVDEYRAKRDATRSELNKIEAANPKTYLAGRVVGGIATGGANGVPKSLAGAAAQGAGYGAIGGAGESNADLTRGEYGDLVKDSVKGAAAGSATGSIGYGVGKGLSSVLDGSLSKGLKKVAEKNAVKATGATGKQISNFDENAGRELLDRGLVKFGDTPEKIANRTQDALDVAHANIDDALKSLDSKGVTVNSENVVNALNDKISKLKKDPSQADVVRKLSGVIEDIKETGESNPIISSAENTKRGFNRIAGNWQDPEKGQAGKEAYLAYKDAVENAAESAAPDTAALFKKAKETHGLLAPIQEASERRANTLAQSPIGGLGDISAAGAGFMKGGMPGAIIAPIARRIISPRAASSIAVSADTIADVLSKAPESFGKYASVLQDAAQKGSRALAATNAFLQKDPEYLKVVGALARNEVTRPEVIPPNQGGKVADEKQSVIDRSPSNLKGEEKWAQSGADKLGLSADETKSALNDKRTRQMLIEASDLSPGSKRLQNIKNQLTQGRGK